MDNKPLLLIDAKNALYRAIHASYASNKENKTPFFVIFLRQITSWMNLFRPESVHVFWDAPRESVWRKKILATYKDRSSSKYIASLAEDLKTTTAMAKEFFEILNVHQYYKNNMEADDLIYAMVSMIHPRTSLIVSTDSDMIQIPFSYNSNTVYDPKKMIKVDIPTHNPVMMKSIVGDDADSIAGYYGIGPKKGRALIENQIEFQQFLSFNDRKILYRNLLLIDLSLCPYLLANKIYIQKQMVKITCFDKDSIQNLIKKYSLGDLIAEYNNLILPFKNLK